MKYLLIIFLLLLAYSCNKPNKKPAPNSKNLDNFFEIKYQDLLVKKHIVNLSQIASNVEYIKLESTENCLLSLNARYFFSDSLIFVSDRDHILKFSINGKFLKKIGNPGRGPGEIDLIRIMSIIPVKRLIVVQKNAEYKLLYFSYDGELVKTVPIPRVGYMKVIGDDRYVAYDPGAQGSEEFNFRLTNEAGDTLSSVKNYDRWVNTTGRFLSVSNSSFKPYYIYRNVCYLKSMYNDTVYSILSDKIKPAFYVNLGKFRLPSNLRPDKLGKENFQKFAEQSSNYYLVSVLQGSEKIFITSICFERNVPLNYLLFDVKSNNGNLLINEKGISTGFVNDWDGGIDFWPEGSVNDNQIFMPVNVINLQKALESNTIPNTSIKFPNKQKQLLDLISKSSATDNPILMIVTLKSNN